MPRPDAGLVPFQDSVEDSLDTPGVRIALDLRGEAFTTRRLSGWFVRWDKKPDDRYLVLQVGDSPDETAIALSTIKAAYWAPVGYQP